MSEQIVEEAKVYALEDLCAQHTDLRPDAVAHLQRLVASWAMLADLSFSDLLLFTRTRKGLFVVLGIARPTTSQTIYTEDPVGSVMEETLLPYVARAWRSGDIASGDVIRRPQIVERVNVQAVPVRYRGAVIAILSRESAPGSGRRPSPLERTYMETATEIIQMITEGNFPFPSEALESPESPRVGDGIIRLDGHARITFASPNAVSSLIRLGITRSLQGQTLADLGIDDTSVRTAYAMLSPVDEEIETADASVAITVIPLIRDGAAAGSVLLVRDVTDIRSRDRLLLTKDATIREIHHRVKNNLQTIASLLRLKGRRLASPEAKGAIDESVRRIRAIALVHDVLSREASEQIPFQAIIRPLLAMVEEALVSSEAHIVFTIDGDAPDLPVEIATPLAIVVTELLQNAVQHAFQREEEGQEPAGEVRVSMSQDSGVFVLAVSDDGIGLPDGFDLTRDARLGLQIVQTLVEGELGGEISIKNAKGTRVEISVPTAEPLATEG